VEAVQLSGALRKAAREVQAGRSDWQQIESAALESLQARGWRPDYVAVRRRSDLGVPARGELLVILGAARLGSTRLIDNIEI
jgi:pantoate--beta-alanine ligase